ncbi:SET and MYND domain-containing protein 4 [Aplysia californica]|uniref:Protein-lysine N-methyltransferase SMYD4 n=1 Tax=Aplysia californica TaxID=6500 RepID=A0ABM0K0J5_APLCA|nr:SET and MYND domain-containing protein 4 [Aplysia californica]
MNPASTAQVLSELTKQLRGTQRYDEFVANFNKCQTDTERVACLHTLPETSDLFPVQEGYKSKNERDAELLRAEGNKLFKAKDYPSAFYKYTQSILKAPSDSANLALAYGNRSTTNFYMKRYRMCLVDIEMAFRHNYPRTTCYKLYQRLGRCMYYLQRKEEAIKAFQQTIIVLGYAPDISEKNKQEMIQDMTNAIEKCSEITSQNNDVLSENFNVCHQGIPELSADPSKEVPSVSDSVEIRLDSYGGRGLFAKRQIEIGEVLIVETPFSSALLKEFNLSHCHYCCNRVFLPLPCHQCSGVVFCSLQCRDTAWAKFHWAECKILENIQDLKGDLGLLASRMILTAKYEDLITLEESAAECAIERCAGFNAEGVYSSSDYCSAHSLVNHSDKRSFKDLLQRTISAVFFVRYLEFVGYFTSEKRLACKGSQDTASGDSIKLASESELSSKQDIVVPSDKEKLLKEMHQVGGHILRNIMMLPCNAHEVSEFSLNPASPAMSCTAELAAAIYPVLSLVNHSCDPSVVRHSFGNVCVARAIRSIRAGEELKDNYGALYPTMELEKRQKDLSSQYFFRCSCEACVDDWPQYFDIPSERPVFRCLACCDGQVPIPLNNLTESAACLRCGNSQDITQVLLQMGEMESMYKDALTAVIDGDNSRSNVQTLLTYLRFVEHQVKRPWRDINDSQEAIKQCLNMQANCFPMQL